MTRFARAHGSKASNERQPEEATSWSTFKQQLLSQQNNHENRHKDNLRPATQLLLSENVRTEWASFEDNAIQSNTMQKVRKRKKIDSVNEPLAKLSCDGVQEKKKQNIEYGSIEIDNNFTKKLKKTKTKKLEGLQCSATMSKTSVLPGNVPEEKLLKKKKTSKTKEFNEVQDDACNFESSKRLPVSIKVDSSNTVEGKHVKQLKKKQCSMKADGDFVCSGGPNGDSLSVQYTNETLPKSHKHLKDRKNKQKGQEKVCGSISLCKNSSQVIDNCKDQSFSTNEKKSKRQKRNLKNLNKHSLIKKRRRKQFVQTSTVMINGEEMKVTMFDGFPVRAKDAEHLEELRKQLTTRGLPATDIKHTMKLERRKAEKALAREKRKVCFHCRKGGHNLSDCPELNSGSNQDASGTGICFKCGSTEHTHFQCRVVRGQEFRFAKCFICQEQGHISRQCPDNPRGLYPKGGACKICGDVTHLKKDCPDLHEEKEQNTFTLKTAQGDKLEALDEELQDNHQPLEISRKNKIIKF